MLHFCKLSVLEFQQPLERLYLLLQVINATGEFFILTAGAFEFFHRNGRTGIHTTCSITVSTCGTAFISITGPAVLAGQQSQFVPAGFTLCGLP